MNERLLGALKKGRQTMITAFFICAVLFFSGCVLGVFFSCALKDGNPLFEYVAELTELLSGSGAASGLGWMLLHYMRYAAAAFIFGFSILGVVSIPALSAFRGFCFAFSVSSLIRCTGSGGIFLALTLFGIELFVSLPCFFVVSAQSLCASKSLVGAVMRGEPAGEIYGKTYFKRCILCFAILTLLAFVGTYFLPYLVRASI